MTDRCGSCAEIVTEGQGGFLDDVLVCDACFEAGVEAGK